MDEPVVVFTSHGPLGAEVAKSKLSSEGILAVLRFEAVGRVLGLTVDGGHDATREREVEAERAPDRDHVLAHGDL